MGSRGQPRRRRRGLACLTAWLACSALLCAPPGHAQTPHALSAEIPAQTLPEALATYARQTGLQVIYVSGVVNGRRSQGARAGLAPEAALTQLLDGTGLRYQLINSRTVRILAAPARPPPPPVEQRGHAERTADVEEVVITASLEPASRVPESLNVWSRVGLAEVRIKDVADLANLTPGVEFDSYADFGAGIETNLAIRGINARDGSTTAVYVDDTPVMNDRASEFGRLYPVTFDLDRVEVLRGPQGVLLGEGAEGGAVRFVTTPPGLSAWDGLAHGEFALTERGAPSYETGVAVGGPFAPELLGFRFSAWSRRDGGYVDRVDPFTGQVIDPNANHMQTDAVKLALTFVPIGSMRVTPSFSRQSLEVHDTSAFMTYLSDPAEGILYNGKLSRQFYEDHSTRTAINATVATGLADVSFTAAYTRRNADALFDDSNNTFWFWPNPLGPEYPVSYADAKPRIDTLDGTSLSYQLRAASADPDARVTWLAGLEYIHEVFYEWQSVATSALDDGGFINGISIAHRSTLELGAYAQADLHLGERFTLSLGARAERDSYDSNQAVGAIGVPNFYPAQFFELVGSSTPVAPRASLSFQADRDHLYYLSAANGYRAGGPNISVGHACPVGTPTGYGPDSVWSFEFGTKNRLLDERLQTNASLFHMVWTAMQTQVPFLSCGFGYTTNAGRAVSNGVDFGAQADLTDHLQLKLTAAYAAAHYTQTVYFTGQVVATDGDVVGALPLVPPPLSAVASVDYRIPLSSGATATLRAFDIYHSHNPGPFTTQNPDAVVYAPERGSDPATNLVNLAAVWGGRPDLDVSLFANNLFDRQPTLQLRNRIPGDTLFYATTFRPRTVGLAVNWRFGSPAVDGGATP